jgi:hypothetical protein
MAEIGSKRRFRDWGPGVIATSIGPLEREAESALHAFLLVYRRIIECGATTSERMAQMEALWRSPEHATILEDIPSNWRTIWAAEELDALLGIGPTLCWRLVQFKLWEVGAIRRASDETLLEIEGIGEARLAAIRKGTA